MATTQFTHPQRECQSKTAGFSLVELLVVISTIILLIGMTLAVSTSVLRAGERRQTQRTLDLLQTSLDEWELLADRQLSWWHSTDENDPQKQPANYDVHFDTPEVLIITEMLAVIERARAVEDLLANLNSELTYRYKAKTYPRWINTPAAKKHMDVRFVGELTVLDAWGTPIYATHPGSLYQPGTEYAAGMTPDPDGTIRTYNENSYGVTRNRQVCFVSAGPDGRFGKRYAGQNTQLLEETFDNISSYPTEDP